MNFEISENVFLAFLPPFISIAVLAVQAWLGRQFATIGGMTALATRVTTLEGKADEAPRHEDVAEMEHRLNALEVMVGEMRAEVRGVREGVGRVEHMVTLLVEHGLRKEAAHHAQ